MAPYRLDFGKDLIDNCVSSGFCECISAGDCVEKRLGVEFYAERLMLFLAGASGLVVSLGMGCSQERRWGSKIDVIVFLICGCDVLQFSN